MEHHRCTDTTPHDEHDWLKGRFLPVGDSDTPVNCPGIKPRWGVCDDTCTADCGHCKGSGIPRLRFTFIPPDAPIVPAGTDVAPDDVKVGDFIVDPLLGEVFSGNSNWVSGYEGWSIRRAVIRAAIRPAPPEPGPEVVALRSPSDGSVIRRHDTGRWDAFGTYARAVAEGYTEHLIVQPKP